MNHDFFFKEELSLMFCLEIETKFREKEHKIKRREKDEEKIILLLN